MAFRMTKSERLARRNRSRDEFVVQAIQLDSDVPDKLPAEWKPIAHDMDVIEKKEKATLNLDRSVARMHRQMGQGYPGGMNRVLRVWMQCKTAEWMDFECGLVAERHSNIMSKMMRSGLHLRDWPSYDEDVMKWMEEGDPGEGES